MIIGLKASFGHVLVLGTFVFQEEKKGNKVREEFFLQKLINIQQQE